MSGIAARRRMASDQVFALEHLRTEFRIDGAGRAAVDDVSFALVPHETLTLVGGPAVASR
jgi:ABC-type glutathione transport system ATPase component